MGDLRFQIPVADEVEVSAETFEAIDRGIKDVDDGRTVPMEELRKLIPPWNGKSEVQKTR